MRNNPSPSTPQLSRDVTPVRGSRSDTRQLSQSVALRYRRRIRNADGSLAFESPWKRNLILDSGLNEVGTRPWRDCFAWAAVGTGNDPTARDSGATTFTAAAGAVAASAGFFEAADVGRLLRLDSGEQGYITAFTDASNVNWNGPDVGVAAEGTVYYVDDTALETEAKRTNSVLSNVDWTWNSGLGAFVASREFQFSAEVGTVTYSEIGWSWSNVANLFGRDVYAGDVLVAGQQYEITVEVTLYMSPTAATASPDVGTGCDTTGDAVIECVGADTGLFVKFGGSGVYEPSGVCKVGFYTAALTLSPVNSGAGPVPADTPSVAVALGAYSSGTFTRTKSATAGTSVANGTIHAAGLLTEGAGSNGNRRRGFTVLFDTPFAKSSSQTLNFTFRLSWQRFFA